MDEQNMQIFVHEQIMKLTTFGGARDEDVLHWLQDTECIFDSVQLRPLNKYIAVQSYLVGFAAKWFRFNKMNIPDWSSFKIAIAQAYQPSFNRTLSVIEQRPITVQHVNSSSVSPKTAPDSSPISQDHFSALIDLSGSNSNVPSPPSSKIEKSSTPERITNDDQQLTIVVLPEPSSLHQFLRENLTDDSTVDCIPNTSSSIITITQSTCSSTVAIDNPITCEDELQEIPNDQVNLYSSNDLGVIHRVLSPVMQLVKVNVHGKYNDTNVDLYVTHTLIDPKILGSIETQQDCFNISFYLDFIYHDEWCILLINIFVFILIRYKLIILLIRDIYLYVKRRKKCNTEFITRQHVCPLHYGFLSLYF
ncbi:unnamed protein product [Rotaria socialis]|uniref:Retrotransposon gag domain-containing protein n=1 Tax=Rotaria socialis TaxID=392032 RepID=A0A818E8H5_9BILA|nr:unnamed protein product [Rotaria socialis]